MNLNSICFNSRDIQHKTPFGAVTQGTEVKFTLSSEKDLIRKARLVVEIQRIEGNFDKLYYVDAIKYPLKKIESSDNGDNELWSCTVKFSNLNVYGYYFEIEDGEKLFYYGNNDQKYAHTIFTFTGTGGAGKLYTCKEDMPRFNQTVYDPEFKTPDWAKDTIYYYIFPERFKNGDKTNDPKPGARKFYDNIDVEFHENWNEKPYIAGDGRGDDIHCNDFFGGDLAGVMQKLDYLKDLGINTIYFNPIFQALSNHKYDTSDYLKIDEAFGTNELFKELVEEAKAKGIKIILDTSINHCGCDSVYLDRYGKHEGLGAFKNGKMQKESPYRDWFIFNEGAENPDEAYERWLGVPSLATLAEVDSFKDFAYRNEDSVTKYWLNMGIAGWRMDVTPWKSETFWREWRREVKETNPDALAIGEVWWDSSKYLLGDQYDSVMNYLFRYPIFDYVKGGSARDFVNILEMVRENYPEEAFYSLMNLLSTHDASRALHEFGYKNDTDSEETVAEAKKKLLLCVLFQMTYPGAPTIYYGDEVGVTGGEDPMNRCTYPWEEEGGNPDYKLLGEFKKLIGLRNDNKVLRRGTVDMVHADDNIIVMLRKLDNDCALIAVNNSKSARNIELDLSEYNLSAEMVNPFDERDVLKSKEGKLTLKINGISGVVYLGR